MKVDLYTKTVLTGILGCLLWLCATMTPIGTPVQAQLSPTQVVLAGFQEGGQVVAFGARGLPVTMLTQASAATPQPLISGVTTAPAPPVVERPATARPVSSQPAARQQCAATTKRGTRCSRLADAGSAYCWQHK